MRWLFSKNSRQSGKRGARVWQAETLKDADLVVRFLLRDICNHDRCTLSWRMCVWTSGGSIVRLYRRPERSKPGTVKIYTIKYHPVDVTGKGSR